MRGPTLPGVLQVTAILLGSLACAECSVFASAETVLRRRSQPSALHQQVLDPPPPQQQRKPSPPSPPQQQPGARYFGAVALAGAISCSLTHSAVVPLDVIKTRLQTDASLSGPRDAVASLLASARGSGPAAHMRPFISGLGATAVGYMVQGAAKFGGYELFKRSALTSLHEAGERGEAIATTFKLPIMIGSAALAEVFASAALCPLEVIKLRMQTDAALASVGLKQALVRVAQSEGVGTLFQGFMPIALRQVPYTACKLVSFEVGVSVLRAAVRARHRGAYTLGGGSSSSMVGSSSSSSGFSSSSGGGGGGGGGGTCPACDAHRLPIVLTAGLGAGALAAVVSQPFDLLLTRVCGSAAVDAVAGCVIAEGVREQLAYLVSLGPAAFTGLAPRLAMVSVMTSLQFVVYDSLRIALGCAPVPLKEPTGSRAAASATSAVPE